MVDWNLTGFDADGDDVVLKSRRPRKATSSGPFGARKSRPLTNQQHIVHSGTRMNKQKPIKTRKVMRDHMGNVITSN